MRLILAKLITLCVVLGVFTGCATTDSGRTRAEGTGFGALLGAALGAGIGYAAGGTKGAVIGAGVGGAAGAGAGYVVGDAVAEKKQQYVNNEDRLDSQISSVAQCNCELRKYNVQTAARIKKLNKEVANLKSRYKKGKVRINVLTKKQEEINQLIRVGDEHKISMSKELADLIEYRKTIASTDKAKVAKLSHEIASLKKYISVLDSNNRQLAKLVTASAVRK